MDAQQAMLDALHEDQIPETWHILRPERELWPISMMAAIGFAIACNLLYLVITIPIIYDTSHQQLGNNLLDVYTHYPYYFLAFLPQIATVGLALLFRHIAKNQKDAILVLTPEGIFECEHLNDANRRQITAIEYENIEEMILKVTRANTPFSTTIEIPSSPIEVTVPQIFGAFEFFIQYQDGTRKKWLPHQKFGFGYQIAQWVVNDYHAYIRGNSK